MKYSTMDWGTMEAVVNKLGGMEGVQRFLQGNLTVSESVLMIDCNINPQIPDWADKNNPIMKHYKCGLINPSKLTTVSVFKEGEEVLEGEEFIIRAQKLNSMNACAFDFYSKPENWKYLPIKGVDVIVFPKTEFRGSVGDRYVRYLFRDGSEWDRDHVVWIDGRFGRYYRVAVLAS